MSRRPLVLTATAATTATVAAALLALFAWTSRPVHAPAASAARTTAAAPAPLAALPPASGHAAWARYHLASTQRAALDGREQALVVAEGTWTTIERANGRTEAQFAASRIEVVGDQAPSPAEVAGPIELIRSEGVLTGITFAEGTSRAARALLTGLATTFQSTARSGPSWSIEEEDLLGRYVADYQRGGDHITRTRSRYTALRDATGLSATRAASLVPTESSELRFDARGLVSATVRIDSTVRFGKGALVLEMSLAATLVREATDDRPLVAGPGRAPLAISDHIDHAALATTRAVKRVAGAKTPAVLAEAEQIAHLDRALPDSRAKRGAALRRLTALTQVDPDAPSAIAGTIRLHPGDKDAVGLFLGALSSSPAPGATNALASLLEGDEVPDDVRSQVFTHLTLARTPTAESAAMLIHQLTGPSGDEAALALGAQARGLDGDGAADEAIDQLLSRYAQASTASEKRLALLALANSGSIRVLDAMKSALQSGDFELARVAAFGLRLIPGDEVDTLLLLLIQGGSPVVLEAIHAVAYRGPVVWRPRLEAAKQQFAGQKPALDAIQVVLSQWANPAG